MSDKLYPGFWNGEEAKFRVVMGIVGPEPEDLKQQIEKTFKKKRYLWFQAFLGQQREMIEVNYPGANPFCLDNGDGSGFKKVLEGRGSPQYGHRSIYPSVILSEVSKDNWTRFSNVLAIQTDVLVDQYWMTKDPVEYEQHKKEMELLKKMINGKKQGIQ